MSKITVKIAPKEYLSGSDLKKTRRISRSLRKTKSTDELLEYKEELNDLIRKAVINKHLQRNQEKLKERARNKLQQSQHQG